MFKIKVSYPYPNWPLLQQTPNSSGIWGDCQFFINQDIKDCDYWVVLDGLLKTESAMCPKANTLLITWEPPTIRVYTERFIKQFANVITCQRSIKCSNINYAQQAHPWLVQKTYDQLTSMVPIKKKKLLSVVSSAKQSTEGHRKRYQLALDLKKYFGDEIDLFGRGIRDFKDKWDVLAPYKYSIAIENFSLDDWLTEKLPDCYLAFTFPFYYGCSNVAKYFRKESFSVIDFNDFSKTVTSIKKVITDEHHYDNHLKFVLESRDKYLNQYNLFPMIVEFIKAQRVRNTMKKTYLTISPDMGRFVFLKSMFNIVRKYI